MFPKNDSFSKLEKRIGPVCQIFCRHIPVLIRFFSAISLRRNLYRLFFLYCKTLGTSLVQPAENAEHLCTEQPLNLQFFSIA